MRHLTSDGEAGLYVRPRIWVKFDMEANAFKSEHESCFMHERLLLGIPLTISVLTAI
jgi:hypothetical protein